jgi:3-methyl-2-oxobutanoate hydroxymethyltransferase
MKSTKSFSARDIMGSKGIKPLVMVTAYDALMASMCEESGCLDMLLVGDSLGNVVAGQTSTLPVTLDDILYHARCVRRGASSMFLVADLPFMTYPYPRDRALEAICRVMQDTGVQAVKMEGASPAILELVEQSVQMGAPVMGHIGLTPQQQAIDGLRRKGRSEAEAQALLEQGLALQAAGVFALVLECIQQDVAATITRTLRIPTIGIGSGPRCDGQVLVYSDLLGLTRDPPPFVKPLANMRHMVMETLRAFKSQVEAAGQVSTHAPPKISH